MMHGPTVERFVIRMAAEGIPTRAIARILQIHQIEVGRVIKIGVGNNLLKAIPQDEWPEGSRLTERVPMIPVVDLGDVESVRLRLTLLLDVTPAIARVLAVMLALEGMVPKATLHVAIAGGRDVSTKLIDVYICKARIALRAHQINIITHWGQGYEIPPSDRVRFLTLLAGLDAPEEAAHAA